MIVFIGSGFFIGGLLGASRTVLALIPATLLAICVATFAYFIQPSAIDWSLSHLIVLSVFLQIGYLGGAGFSLLIMSAQVVPRKGPKPYRDPLLPRAWSRNN
jgi:hypothetical protein